MLHESSVILKPVDDRLTTECPKVSLSLYDCGEVFTAVIRLAEELPDLVRSRLQSHESELTQLFNQYSSRLLECRSERSENTTTSVPPNQTHRRLLAFEEEQKNSVAVIHRLRCELAETRAEIRDVQRQTRAYLGRKVFLRHMRECTEADRLNVNKQLASDPRVRTKKLCTSRGIITSSIPGGLLQIHRAQKEVRHIKCMIRKLKRIIIREIITDN